MNPYLKYTSLGFQLLFYVFAGYFIGKLIAQFFDFKETTGSVFGMLLFTAGGLYKIIREVLRESGS